MKKLTPYQFWLKIAQWGSYIRGSDPGAVCYGFNESGRVQSEDHRARCLDWIENHCMPGANKRDKAELNRLKDYLMTAELVK